ncbi:equilibrative nucleotide transporter 3 [Prunus yedoensis var. nudiflora]|uniref:Equilibrative nucleotide transporter 3 n=1 Tax=Prunus yedoensis var. nudiflora TaxID=2094558 RepID=A0A314YQF2_PRUYE|nr:equilibrative nucleotide transporter 3 [Prunus yedoensis var. nudiflora]
MGHLYGKPQVWQHIPPNQVLSIMHEDAEGNGYRLKSKLECPSNCELVSVQANRLECPSNRVEVDLAMSGSGTIATYIGICACVGAFGVADAHVQGGMVGDLSFMRPEFIQIGLLLKSFFAGLAASGALTSGKRLMTNAAFEKYHNGLRKGASM